MSSPFYFDEETKAQWRYAFDQAGSDCDRYLNWIKAEISIAANLIDRYDKIYLLGGLGARLIQTTPHWRGCCVRAYGLTIRALADNTEAPSVSDSIEIKSNFLISFSNVGQDAASQRHHRRNINISRHLETLDKFDYYLKGH